MATNPQQAAQDWVAGLSSRTSKITAGVQGVSVAPGQAAARQKAVYVQNVQASQDKWARNVAAVPLATWQQAMTEKGVPRIATGASQAESKMADFFTRFLPHVDQVRRSLPPRGTLDQNIQRMVANARGMANFQNK